MNRYEKQIRLSLLNNSTPGLTIEEAVKEWKYNGEYFIAHIGEPVPHTNGTAGGFCQLCGKTPIVYHFLIRNEATKRELWVGSECIQNCGMAGHFQVAADRKKMETETKKKNWLAKLEQVKDRIGNYQRIKSGIEKYGSPLPNVAREIRQLLEGQ